MVDVHPRVSLMLELHKVRYSDLCLFMYINDLTENPRSNLKLFADDTSLFTIINDSSATAK